jgi:hypothetical protein
LSGEPPVRPVRAFQFDPNRVIQPTLRDIRCDYGGRPVETAEFKTFLSTSHEFLKEAVMTNMQNCVTGERTKHRPRESNVAFIAWATVISIGIILLSIAWGVGIDPDASMFTSP